MKNIEEGWSFTYDEKMILRNLPNDYVWLVRNENKDLMLCKCYPHKVISVWDADKMYSLNYFKHIFNSIRWEDKEPCEFKKYL